MSPPLRLLLLHSAMLVGWLALHVPTFGWLVRRWTATEGQVHLVLAGMLLLALARHVDPVSILDRLARPLHWHVPALLWATVPPVAAALLQHVAPLNALTGMAAVASAYGLLGLFTSPARWRSLLGAAGLAVALLPLTEHLDVFLGYPLRAATAHAVAALLGTPDVTASTVLAVDGALAHVDLPCSGVRSLWSGLVVLLGASVAWRRPVNLRFAVVTAIMVGALVVANTLRVGTLVAVEHVLGWRLGAEILHLPLGVVGFAGAVGVGLWLLARGPEPGERRVLTPSRGARPWMAAALLATWLGVWMIPPPAPQSAMAAPALTLPADLEPIPVSAPEAAFAARHAGQLTKARLHRGDLRGTLVMVSSRSWLAHHVPTWCLQSAGWTLSGEQPQWVGASPVRQAEATRDEATATALWWFQSADTLTDDHTRRIARGLWNDEPWVLVSVLLHGSVDPADADVHDLIDDLRALAADALEIP